MWYQTISIHSTSPVKVRPYVVGELLTCCYDERETSLLLVRAGKLPPGIDGFLLAYNPCEQANIQK